MVSLKSFNPLASFRQKQEAKLVRALAFKTALQAIANRDVKGIGVALLAGPFSGKPQHEYEDGKKVEQLLIAAIETNDPGIFKAVLEKLDTSNLNATLTEDIGDGYLYHHTPLGYAIRKGYDQVALDLAENPDNNFKQSLWVYDIEEEYDCETYGAADIKQIKNMPLVEATIYETQARTLNQTTEAFTIRAKHLRQMATELKL